MTRLLPFLLLLAALPASAEDLGPEFNFDWLFAKGDRSAAIAPDFDDSSWERVDLPHDWAISGPFGEKTANGDTGKLPWEGEGYYRKHFTLPADGEGKRFQLLFDGVMASPVVYLNGRKVGSWTYGYNSFHLDATEAAIWGGKNVLVVHADTRQHKSRWYPGAGIYRKVTARIVGDVHIPVSGVTVTTPEIDSNQSIVTARVEVRNDSAREAEVSLVTRILDPDGEESSTVTTLVAVPPGATESIPQVTFAQNARLWDVASPHLYTAKTTLAVDDTPVQEVSTTFGFRTFEWTANDGFHLNGRRLQLFGVNLHHDHGMLGAAFFPRAMERQLEIMRDMGVNAIRTSHNTPAPELLDLCDRMGFVVWDELFDKYGPTAGVDCNYDVFINEHAEKEVVNFVRRDRNHPSIVTWSIGNEINGIQNRHVEKMVEWFKEHDPTRPVGFGSHVPDQARRGRLVALDLTGWNYAQKYMVSREHNPEQPLVYSETASAFGTRGHYEHDLPSSKLDYRDDGQLSAHMLTAAPWSDIPEVEFERMRKHDFVAGEFVWTGFDYLGEPTPYNGRSRPMKKTPDGHVARSSYFGIVDLAGLPKDSYYLYRSHWLPDEPTVHLAPHWNWPGREGQPTPVFLYTNGDEAELFLNGKSLGRRSKIDPDAPNTTNLAYGKNATASSEETKQDNTGNVIAENLAQKAVDGNPDTRWCASDANPRQHLQVDLGKTQSFTFVRVLWEKEASNYGFNLLASDDGSQWHPISTIPKINGSAAEYTLEDTLEARFLRVETNEVAEKVWASIAELEVSEKPQAQENPYYKIVDAYRLRWMDVAYQPGELKAVAYKDGERIGESIVRTAGAPAKLQLTADRTELNADGMDLCYVTVEMQDKAGTLCPLAMDKLKFSVEGAATLMGVANGNPMGHDSFTDATHPLFYGKAVAVLRSKPGTSGPATLKVKSGEGLSSAVSVAFTEE